MMKIDTAYFRKLGDATCAGDLHGLVQEAIKLEHATIPPYLCAYFTLQPGTNEVVAETIRSVVVEEMLHMTVASNLLSALDGTPAINAPGFVPDYPGGLPFGIGDHLQIHLEKCSIPQVQDVFMAIEEPEEPIDIPTATPLSAMLGAAGMPHFETIGAFYACLKHKIRELGPSIFTGDPAKQVTAARWFPDEAELFPIRCVESACAAIDVVVDQGEGTSSDPFDEQGVPAHYYRFKEIVEGRKLVATTGQGGKTTYAFDGAPVVFDPIGVWNMDPDPQVGKYREGSRSQRLADEFNYSYSMLLNALHGAFDGAPERLDHAMGVMYELRLLAQQVLATPADFADGSRNTDAVMTGLPFAYRL